MSIRKTYLSKKGYVRKDGSIKHTKMTMFCLPLLGLSYHDFGKNLINVYSSQEDNIYLYIVLDNPYEQSVDSLINKIKARKDFIEEFKDDSDNEYILKLKISGIYEDDYYKIMSGEYSKISKIYKDILVKTYSDRTHDLSKPPTIVDGQVLTTMYEVLYPTEEKKKVIAKHFGVEISSVKELISKPDIRYELYRKVDELKEEEII